MLWHADRDLQGVDAVDRSGRLLLRRLPARGAIARFAPVMEEVAEFARDGGLVLGICNGFQVLCEARLLPGALLPNDSLQFVFRQVRAGRRRPDTRSRAPARGGERCRSPSSTPTGRFYAPDDELDRLEAAGQVLLRYAPGENPNGSLRDIAGVCNEAGNVFGLMPHPEHAVDPLTGSTDGLKIFESMRAHVADRDPRLAPTLPRARAHRPRVRADRRAARARARTTSSWRCCR